MTNWYWQADVSEIWHVKFWEPLDTYDFCLLIQLIRFCSIFYVFESMNHESTQHIDSFYVKWIDLNQRFERNGSHFITCQITMHNLIRCSMYCGVSNVVGMVTWKSRLFGKIDQISCRIKEEIWRIGNTGKYFSEI